VEAWPAGLRREEEFAVADAQPVPDAPVRDDYSVAPLAEESDDLAPDDYSAAARAAAVAPHWAQDDSGSCLGD